MRYENFALYHNKKTSFFAQILDVDLLYKNLFMLLAVRISSYGCTRVVWRALKKLEVHSAIAACKSYASFVLSKLPACIHNSMIRTLSMNKFLTKFTLELFHAKKGSKKHLILKKSQVFEEWQNWPLCKGYSLCKIVSLRPKIKMQMPCEKSL